MVALVRPNPSIGRTAVRPDGIRRERHLTLLVDNGPIRRAGPGLGDGRSGDRTADVVGSEGDSNVGPRGRLAVADSSMLAPPLLAMMLALGVVVAALVMVRVAQGPPPATTWEGLEVEASASVPIAAQGDEVIVARPGDSLWSIAVGLTDGDPRPVVDALIAANGGSAVQIGQEIVVPGHLLD